MTRGTEPPYLRIVSAIRDRIARGELRPGDRVPSTRSITREWGVAMATATKALAELRREGLVEARRGAGTVVSAPPQPPPDRPAEPALTLQRIVATAVAAADAEGTKAVSMRRIAAELGVGPMSLYRHVASKDELVREMMRVAFLERPLPEPGPPGWRAKLELVCRTQWELYLRHPWLASAVSMTRPQLVPEAMAHTEWTLRALDGLGLDPDEIAREALTLPSMVRGLALSRESEAEAEEATGVGAEQWWRSLDDQVRALYATGRFPLLADLNSEVVDDIDGLFEHALTRNLDGLQARLERGTAPARRP
ncbi:GntR family transcriptional regulator [Saccharopolyspora shandongensis]|uniref:TetR/AcrR family transcriptional regulator C-terminal domain-containing protein n=1 Tax=Saccharopolyspora shandongensis TaxID=418495 RepID=UPI003412B3AF